MLNKIFQTTSSEPLQSLGLLLFRLVFGGFMALGHGLPKLLSYAEKASDFPDPLGIGSPISMAAAIAAELFCGLLLVLGLTTRLAVLPLIFTMAMVAFVIHGDGPLFLPAAGAKEPALMYLFAFVVFLFTGPGKFSLDKLISDKIHP
jgi:putative oxidoreductase